MRRISVLFLLATGLLIVGCGTSDKMSNNPSGSGQPPTQAPPPTPGAAQFSESMLLNDGSGTTDGSVSVDTSGNGTMKVTGGGTASTAYTIQFCPFATGSCNSVGTLTTDSTGAGTQTFTMGHGGFSGIFELTTASDVAFLSGFNIPVNGSSMQAALVRQGTVAGGFPNMGGFGLGSDPLTSGSVAVTAGTSASVQVAGAAANTSYEVTFCFNGGSSSCFDLGALTTDAGGGGQASFDLSQTIGTSNGNSGVFVVTSGSPPSIQFVSGVSVP